MSEIVGQQVGRAGLVTLNRPKALNALSLAMIRDLTALLLQYRDEPSVEVVAVRGQGKDGNPFGAFCAGGDIRAFHEAATGGQPWLEDFFTEEYRLNHLIHTYPKPYAVFLDGIVMGGGMGISGHGREQGRMRITTARTKMAMPETNIGLFPDVGGGYFLSRCPGSVGEYLALSGHMVGAADAIAFGLADAFVEPDRLPALWGATSRSGFEAFDAIAATKPAEAGPLQHERANIDRFFSLPTVRNIVDALEFDGSAWATETAATLRKRSPLMLHVVLEQIRRARSMTLADDLRMERDMVQHCFHLRPGTASETVEGIRALVIDKDHAPRWNPPSIEDVTPEMVAAFFAPVWAPHDHPLRDLG